MADGRRSGRDARSRTTPGGRSGGAGATPAADGNRSALDASVTRGIDRMLGRLPQLERSVLELRFGVTGGHPLPVADVAARLGLTAGEVAEMERRAVARLREVLSPADRETLARLLTRLSA